MKILLFCTVFVANGAFAQKQPPHAVNYQPVRVPQLFFNTTGQEKLQQVPSNWSAQNMGAICRLEWKVESSWRLPLRVRLGSLAYCNWLEQKPNAGKAVPLP